MTKTHLKVDVDNGDEENAVESSGMLLIPFLEHDDDSNGGGATTTKGDDESDNKNREQLPSQLRFILAGAVFFAIALLASICSSSILDMHRSIHALGRIPCLALIGCLWC
mmetsp:Transcript_20585/g.56830  ORF Transcript_20585/g.56830 Transcript_20585/m.56830 type:complete len:110 (+) Transcript_20585:22-351(+)